MSNVKYDPPMTRKEKLEIIEKILAKAKEITDAGYGKVKFVEERDRYEY